MASTWFQSGAGCCPSTVGDLLKITHGPGKCNKPAKPVEPLYPLTKLTLKERLWLGLMQMALASVWLIPNHVGIIPFTSHCEANSKPKCLPTRALWHLSLVRPLSQSLQRINHISTPEALVRCRCLATSAGGGGSLCLSWVWNMGPLSVPKSHLNPCGYFVIL